MPVIKNSVGPGTRGIYISNMSNIIFRNIQIEGYGRAIYVNGSASNILLDNILANGEITNHADGAGFGIYCNNSNNKIRINNCISINYGMTNFFLKADYSLIQNSSSYGDASK